MSTFEGVQHTILGDTPTPLHPHMLEAMGYIKGLYPSWSVEAEPDTGMIDATEPWRPHVHPGHGAAGRGCGGWEYVKFPDRPYPIHRPRYCHKKDCPTCGNTEWEGDPDRNPLKRRRRWIDRESTRWTGRLLDVLDVWNSEKNRSKTRMAELERALRHMEVSDDVEALKEASHRMVEYRQEVKELFSRGPPELHHMSVSLPSKGQYGRGVELSVEERKRHESEIDAFLERENPGVIPLLCAYHDKRDQDGDGIYETPGPHWHLIVLRPGGAWMKSGPKLYHNSGHRYTFRFLGPGGDRINQFPPKPVPWNVKYLRRMVHYILDHCAYSSREKLAVQVRVDNGRPVMDVKRRKVSTQAVRLLNFFGRNAKKKTRIGALLQREGRRQREEREERKRELATFPIEVIELRPDGSGIARRKLPPRSGGVWIERWHIKDKWRGHSVDKVKLDVESGARDLRDALDDTRRQPFEFERIVDEDGNAMLVRDIAHDFELFGDDVTPVTASHAARNVLYASSIPVNVEGKQTGLERAVVVCPWCDGVISEEPDTVPKRMDACPMCHRPVIMVDQNVQKCGHGFAWRIEDRDGELCRVCWDCGAIMGRTGKVDTWAEDLLAIHLARLKDEVM